MNSEIISQVRGFVEEECRKPSSKYGFEPFIHHFIPVVAKSKKLAEMLKEKFEIDFEVLEIASWLHDIGSIIEGRENHHLSGARIAEEKLRELGYSQEKIEKVKECILNHRGSKEKENQRNIIEARILAEADAMDAFDRIYGLFEAAYVYENLDREEARVSVLNKLKNKWNQLHLEESKKIVKSKYDAAILLLGENNG